MAGSFSCDEEEAPVQLDAHTPFVDDYHPTFESLREDMLALVEAARHYGESSTVERMQFGLLATKVVQCYVYYAEADADAAHDEDDRLQHLSEEKKKTKEKVVPSFDFERQLWTQVSSTPLEALALPTFPASYLQPCV